MKKITFLFTFVFASIIAQSQIFFEYDFKADTVAKQLAGRNGWSASTDAGFPGTGLCAGAICENAKVKLDSLTYKGYGSFAKAIDIVKADGLGHFLTTDNTLPNLTFKPTYKNGDKVYVSMLAKFKTAPLGNDGQPSIGQVVRLYGETRFPNSPAVGLRFTVTRKSATDTVFRFGTERNGGAVFTDYVYPFSKTYLIVMRYTYKDSTLTNNDEAAIFINPTTTTVEPTPTLMTTGGDDTYLNRFVFFFNNFTDLATGSITGVKAFRNWTDVFKDAASSTVEIRNEALSVRPTLASNFVELNLDKTYPSVSRVKITDLSGRAVLSSEILVNETSKTLNINGLAKGFYVVSIQNNETMATQKFVKE